MRATNMERKVFVDGCPAMTLGDWVKLAADCYDDDYIAEVLSSLEKWGKAKIDMNLGAFAILKWTEE